MVSSPTRHSLLVAAWVIAALLGYRLFLAPAAFFSLYFLMNLTLQIHGSLLNPLSKHDALPQLLFMALLKIHHFQKSR